MKNLKIGQRGFGTVELVVACLIVAAIAVSGVALFTHHKTSTNAATAPAPSQSTTDKQSQLAAPALPTEPQYNGMSPYSNTKYGLSFYYPKSWTVDEIPTTDSESQNSPVPVEYGINLNSGTDKYSTTAALEIISKDYASEVAYYASTNSGNEQAKVTKVDGTDKGKQYTHFTVTTATSKTEQYFYAVGDKTYSLRSINEELNVQKDSSYWDNFATLYNSLQLR